MALVATAKSSTMQSQSTLRCICHELAIQHSLFWPLFLSLNILQPRWFQDAGTHSGDATLLLPSQRLHLETHRRVMHIAAQLPEPWVHRNTNRKVLDFGNKNPLQHGNNIKTYGNWAFFVGCSTSNSWNARNLCPFFFEGAKLSTFLAPSMCSLCPRPASQIHQFPTEPLLGKPKCQEGSSSSVRAVKVIECNVRASRTVRPLELKPKARWKKGGKNGSTCRIIQSSGSTSSTLFSFFFFKFVSLCLFSISN